MVHSRPRKMTIWTISKRHPHSTYAPYVCSRIWPSKSNEGWPHVSSWPSMIRSRREIWMYPSRAHSLRCTTKTSKTFSQMIKATFTNRLSKWWKIRHRCFRLWPNQPPSRSNLKVSLNTRSRANGTVSTYFESENAIGSID